MPVARHDGGIIRVVKDRDHPYKVLNTTFANDARLSWAARGMLAYLLSKPDDWHVRMKDLINQTRAGRDANRRIFAELEQNGYVSRVRTQGHNGYFEWETYVYETPRSSDDPSSTIDGFSVDG
jgi:DNA-binding MarR family transcriptional regulator